MIEFSELHDDKTELERIADALEGIETLLQEVLNLAYQERDEK